MGGQLDEIAGNMSKSKATVLMVAGVCGVMLLAFGNLPSDKEINDDAVIEVTKEQEEYGEMMERRLEDILSSMEGVGRVQVMVTMESGYYYEYATEYKTDVDRLSDVRETQSEKIQEKNTAEETYVMIANKDGSSVALVSREYTPTLKGVVVICDGGADAIVKASIIETVSVAGNLSTTKIAVSKMSN